MLKILTLRFLVIVGAFLAGSVLGGSIGYEAAYWLHIYPSDSKKAERNEAFLHRVEAIEYSLPCEDLNRVGLNGPMNKDGIIYYLNVHDSEYEVIGLSTDVEGPLITWSGADRPACEKPTSSNPALKFAPSGRWDAPSVPLNSTLGFLCKGCANIYL